MNQKPKIVFVLGDGRSGSTLLDSILASNEKAISIGEGYRFWERFYNANTKCSCNTMINECEFWSNVHRQLIQKIPDYNPQRIKKLIKKYTCYQESVTVNKGLENEEVKFLKLLISEFYAAITTSNPNMEYIVDSSKSPGWAILLDKVASVDVKFIHLERDLPSVASSWKKKIRLPEFENEQKYMPIKTDSSIIRTWFRVKTLSHKLSQKDNYFFLEYSDLCNNSTTLYQLNSFLNWNLKAPFLSRINHAIAGNPSRSKDEEIKIRPYKISNENLNRIQIIYFNLFYKIAKMRFK